MLIDDFLSARLMTSTSLPTKNKKAALGDHAWRVSPERRLCQLARRWTVRRYNLPAALTLSLSSFVPTF
ncbi:MAG TPA: hypothetical protein VGH49_15150 [Xanthobacteraceae bacterium]